MTKNWQCHYFREGEKKRPALSSDDSFNVMRTALTRDEFANALGMRPSDIFVNKMFKIVDKDQDERISFQVSDLSKGCPVYESLQGSKGFDLKFFGDFD